MCACGVYFIGEILIIFLYLLEVDSQIKTNPTFIFKLSCRHYSDSATGRCRCSNITEQIVSKTRLCRETKNIISNLPSTASAIARCLRYARISALVKPIVTTFSTQWSCHFLLIHVRLNRTSAQNALSHQSLSWLRNDRFINYRGIDHWHNCILVICQSIDRRCTGVPYIGREKSATRKMDGFRNAFDGKDNSLQKPNDWASGTLTHAFRPNKTW